MKFEDWMLAEGLSESTIKKYVGAIDGSLTTWGNQHAIINQPLRTVKNSQEFAAFSELIEATEIFSERNARGNHMYGAALRKYARYLEVIASGDFQLSAGPFRDELLAIAAAEAGTPLFEPSGQEDGRKKVLREVVRRQGQAQFRSELIAAYENKCAVTRCPVVDVLEAAHITPYLGPATNMASNGLLLRADIHTLWDLALIAIDPISMLLSISPAIVHTNYRNLSGTRPFEPVLPASRPSPAALQQQWTIFNDRHKSLS